MEVTPPGCVVRRCDPPTGYTLLFSTAGAGPLLVLRQPRDSGTGTEKTPAVQRVVPGRGCKRGAGAKLG